MTAQHEKGSPEQRRKRGCPTPQRVAAASAHPWPEGLFGAVGPSGRKCWRNGGFLL